MTRVEDKYEDVLQNIEFAIVQTYRNYPDMSDYDVMVTCEDGEAKFWIEPIVSLAISHGLNPKKLNEIQKIVEEHKNEIIKAWQRHFSKR